MNSTTAASSQGHLNPRRYFVFIGGKPRPYTPPRGKPAPFSIRYHGKWRLIYTASTDDGIIWLPNPGAQVRFTVRPDAEAMWWKLTTRQGGCLFGDRYDLHGLRGFKVGTPVARLKRVLRWLALRDCHRVVQEAPDIVSAWRWRPAR